MQASWWLTAGPSQRLLPFDRQRMIDNATDLPLELPHGEVHSHSVTRSFFLVSLLV